MKKLIALLALAPIAAPAAKLCVVSVAATTPTWGFNSSAGIWAAGTGCPGNSVDNTSTSITDPASICASRAYSGLSSCSDATSGPNESGGLNGEVGKRTICWCKITYPFAGFWSYLLHPTEAYCAIMCGYHCIANMRVDDVKYRSLLFATPVPLQ